MEQHLIVPTGTYARRKTRSEGGVGPTDVESIDRAFVGRVVDRLSAFSASPDVSEVLIRHEATGEEMFEKKKASERRSPVNVTVFPATGVLLLQGPNGVGDFLKRGRRETFGGGGVDVLQVPKGSVRPAPSREADGAPLPPNGLWHLGPAGIDQSVASRAVGGEGRTIGLIDSGIDGRHSEFKGRTVYAGVVGAGGLEAQRTAAPTDLHGHGTHMAAVAAGNICGVAPRAAIAMVACPALGSVLSTGPQIFLEVVIALEFLLTLTVGGQLVKVDVVNFSLGLPGYTYLFRPIMPLIRSRRDVLFVAAIGNDGRGKHRSPADYKGFNSVGAYDDQQVLWPDSCRHRYGPRRRILVPRYLAPGHDVWSARTGGGYLPMSGTSISAAIASGVAAVGLSEKTKNSRRASWNFAHARVEHEGEIFHKILC